MNNKELDNILDKVSADIRGEEVQSATVKGAAERVWMKMSAVDADARPSAAAPAERIEGCADFQSLMPAYLRNELSEARALLLVDHTHECIPCRKALKQARTARVAAAVAPRRQARTSRYNINPVILRWGIAAVLLIGVGLVAWPLVQRYLPIGSIEATVQAADGPVYLVEDAKTNPLTKGSKLSRGQVIRTAKDAHAVVRLKDGTTIEMKERSEFSINQTLRGTTIHLDSGSVIVEAAKQKDHLYLDTGDSLVAVTGTIFSANAGTKGSRVSVIEGQVNFDRNGNERTLKAGEQATTSNSIETIPVKDEVSWSRNAARYTQTLDALTALNKELNAVQQPDVRHSTRLLDMMPENTVLYAAVPNLAATIVESNRIIEEKIQQNPALHDWFQNRREPGLNSAMTAIRDFGDQLGDEIAVGAGMDEKGEPVAPIVLAELKNPAGFHAFFDAEMQKLNADGKNRPQVTWIDDPKTAQPVADNKAGDKDVYVWINGDVLVASPKLAELQRIANTPQSGFAATAFRNRIADVYREGAGVVVGADLEKILARVKTEQKNTADAGKHEQALTQLGVMNLKTFVLDQKKTDGKTHTRAVLGYDKADHGITAWLAQPGPMGSIEYISPDANIAAGFVVKNPTAVVDDLLGVINSVCPDLNKHLQDLEKNHGLNLRNDIAAPLGGEYAFAIDGPILPVPSWKLVFQVNDPAHLQQTFERVVNEVNAEAAKDGKKGLEWDRADVSGRTFYTLRSADFGFEVNYVFTNGYLIAGPSRALVEQALRYHDSGTTLKTSPKFTAGLPADGQVNFSAFVYHNIASLVQPFAKTLGGANMPSGPQKAMTMAAMMEPTLAYAYAYGDHMEVAANTDGGPFGISPATLLGMPNAFELHNVLDQGVKSEPSQPKQEQPQTKTDEQKDSATPRATSNAAPAESMWKRRAERVVTRARDVASR
jgi:FecR-like protein/putative zinc finger protein